MLTLINNILLYIRFYVCMHTYPYNNLYVFTLMKKNASLTLLPSIPSNNRLWISFLLINMDICHNYNDYSVLYLMVILLSDESLVVPSNLLL